MCIVGHTVKGNDGCCDGEFISFLDDDDAWNYNKLSLQNKILKKSEKALSFIKIMISNNNPLFLLPFEKKDLISLEPLVRKFRHKFNEIIILGTGGSSLGAQAICSLASYKTTRNHKTPKLTFVDNIDSERFESLFKRIDYAKTGFVVISKSGNTLETISQFHLCFNSMEKKIGIKKASKHFVLITQNGKNTLRTIAKYLNILILMIIIIPRLTKLIQLTLGVGNKDPDCNG